MEGVFGVLMPVLIVISVLFYRYKVKELDFLRGRKDPKQLGPAADDKQVKLLEERIQTLESIVTGRSMELNDRLNRLAAEQSRQLALAERTAEPDGPPDTSTNPTLDVGYRLGQLNPSQVVLGRYTVLRELGRGGMGAVYLANDAKLNERVALKTISSLTAGDPEEMRSRFTLEVQAARRVTHPNVIRIHDLGDDGPLLFLSMEFVDGETLWARVKRMGPPSISEALAILGKVTAGMAAAHAAGVIHRDLKPQNILVAGAPAKTVKVIDFGLAKTSFLTGMTATGMILGTPEYMAPEQIRGGCSDARTDVYALGATAYYVLTGRPPFTAPNPIAVGFAQVHDTPKSLRAERAEVPVKVEEIVMRSLAKAPTDRYRDASELKAALDGA